MPTLNRLLSDNVPIDPTKNVFTGNGSQVDFTLTGGFAVNNANPNNLIVSIDGAIQEPNDDYSLLNNTTLRFTTAPDSGSKIVVIYRNAPYTIGSTTVTDGSVTTAKIAAGNVTQDRLSTGAPFWNSIGNVALGHSSPATNLHLNYANYGAILLGNNNSNGFHITKEASDNTFNIWSGAVGTGTNRVRIMPSGNIGFGGIDAQARVHLRGNNTGTTIGNNSAGLWLETTNANVSILEIEDYRVATGSGWPTAGYRIQQRTDSSFQSYIQFNGNNDHGISVGTGWSSVAHSVPERIRIDQNGVIDSRGNPITECLTTAKAWICFSSWELLNYTPFNAPANVYIQTTAGNTTGSWFGFSAGWSWNNLHEGLIYFLNSGGGFQSIGGVAAVPGVGVRIKLTTRISANEMRFVFLDGVPNFTGQAVQGNGGPGGFAYSTNGVKEQYNISSITRHGPAEWTVFFARPFPSKDFVWAGGTTRIDNQNNWITGRRNTGQITDAKLPDRFRFEIPYSNATLAANHVHDVTLVFFGN
jgi:hypothetical protein